MKTTKLLLTLLLAARTTVHAEPEIKGTATELTQYLTAIPHTVELVGEAEVKLPADQAIVSVRVVTEHKSLQEASRANQELRAKMLLGLAEQGIPTERVKASKFSSTPKYGVFGEKPKSYRVENIVKITTKDEKEFQAVARLVDTNSEFRHEGIEFDHSDKDGLKMKALEQAIDKVSDKKRIYEEKLGIKLTPKSFSEARVVADTPLVARRMYAKPAESIAYDLPGMGKSPLAPLDEAESTFRPSFDELVFKAIVTVEYAVESK